MKLWANGSLDREQQPNVQQYLYESSLEYIKRLGRLYEQCGQGPIAASMD